jgi:hypothetical protein
MVITSYPYLIVYDIEPGVGTPPEEPKTIAMLRVLHGAMQWPPEGFPDNQ